MGPSAIRYAGLAPALERIGHRVRDTGNVSVSVMESRAEQNPQLRYIAPILETAAALADRVADSCALGHLPLVIGGDHSLALGSIRGATRRRNLGVIWIDAHGDFNTHETSSSGNIHGMPLAALCGLGDARLVKLGNPARMVNPRNVVVIGARDLDDGERALMQHASVNVIAMEQIDRIGMHAAMQRALEYAMQGTDGIYLSLDLDALDPLDAPGVGTPVPGGITYREAHLACEMIAEAGKLVGMDLVEVNPILDERNRTGILAVELAASALGKRVWKE
ncbi:MAG: arginase [Chloroflexi bacterium]|nr:arginase [Chloroflexota bacterium]